MLSSLFRFSSWELDLPENRWPIPPDFARRLSLDVGTGILIPQVAIANLDWLLITRTTSQTHGHVLSLTNRPATLAMI